MMNVLTIKGIIDEDFVNYKLPSMTIMFPKCSFKCDKESGRTLCQNSSLANEPDIVVGVRSLCERYVRNDITKAVVMQGLEPMDSFEEAIAFTKYLRKSYQCDDDIVIYTGYTPNEIEEKIERLKPFGNIVIKYGRYVDGQKNHYDDVLGVFLSSDNQYAVRL